MLERNVGRDISKYFFGGYTMGQQMKNIHSIQAQAIANRMVVGHIETQQLVDYVRCIRSQKVEEVNTNTKTFYLESAM